MPGLPVSAPSPLDALRDIVTPDSRISAWPPAPGWIALGVLAVLVLALAVALRPHLARRRIQRRRAHAACAEAESLRQRYLGSTATPAQVQCYLQQTNALFKRLVACDDRLHALALQHGARWENFLAAQDGGPGEAHRYGTALYAAMTNETLPDHDALHAWVIRTLHALASPSKRLYARAAGQAS